MTTSNLKHHPETLILQPESSMASQNQRLTRKTLQLGSNCSLEPALENNNQSSSPTKLLRNKAQSQAATGFHQQPTVTISNPKASKACQQRKRRVTSMISLKPISKQQKSASTPERDGYKDELEQTSRKNEASVSLECEQDNTSNPSFLQVNHVNKRSQQLSSPYAEQRKSYRKSPRSLDKDFISCRRSNDAFENKIVGIINKMLYGKTCAKEITHATQRMGKLNVKELLNKKIISGFSVIVRLASERAKDYDKELLSRMKRMQQNVIECIDSELGNYEEYQQQIETPEVDKQQLKTFLIRKVYQLLKKKSNAGKQELREGCIRISEAFINRQSFHKNSVLKLLRKVQTEGIVETIQNLENFRQIERQSLF